jgi:hypothetical protein
MSATPSPEKINELKQKFPERSLHQVDITICGETHTLLMTGPSTVEYDKYTDEMLKAIELKDSAEKQRALRRAQLTHVLAETRWPDRDDVNRLFEHAPEAVDEMQKPCREHAGSSAEVRSKKL